MSWFENLYLLTFPKLYSLVDCLVNIFFRTFVSHQQKQLMWFQEENMEDVSFSTVQIRSRWSVDSNPVYMLTACILFFFFQRPFFFNDSSLAHGLEPCPCPSPLFCQPGEKSATVFRFIHISGGLELLDRENGGIIISTVPFDSN